MARQTYLTTDPAALKPVVEALIFASEEPLPARLLVRFLAGEREESPKGRAAADENGTMPESESAGVPEQIADAQEPEAGDAEAPAERVAGDIPGDTAEQQSAGWLANAASGTLDAGRDAEEASVTEESESDRTPLDESEADDVPEDASEDLAALAGAAERAEERAGEREAGMLIGDGFGEPIDQRLLRRLIDELNAEYQDSGRAFRIVEIAGGFQFATIREYGEYVALLSKEKGRRRLSPAALETLAIIAYRQPVAKPELESIRGVNSDQVLLSLLEKNLIAITGRADTVGRPLLYGTTDEFLRIFGLNSLSDLPKLREIEELMEEDAYSAERVETITIAESSDVEEIEARVGAAGRGPDETQDTPHDETLVFDMTSGEAEATTGDDQGDMIEPSEDSTETEIGLDPSAPAESGSGMEEIFGIDDDASGGEETDESERPNEESRTDEDEEDEEDLSDREDREQDRGDDEDLESEHLSHNHG